MNSLLKCFSLLATSVATIFSLTVYAQSNYTYMVDLNNVQSDQLTVELIVPKITKQNIAFYLPKIVPGTYMNSNYGKYVHNLKATDKSGKELMVKKTGDNSWEISKATALYKLTYQVEDTWDSEINNRVYSMCGTNFEAGKNFVINTPGLFGYFEGMKKLPFEFSFIKPTGFYAATGLKPVSSSAVKDVFRCKDADELYDSPLMFSLPDTTSIRVGNADVLVAVYSPKKQATATFIAANLEKLLMGTKDYLGGKLPVDKYAFIFYFNGEQKKLETSGAWEHSYSSFYSLDEEPQEKAIGSWVDISAHEFFHIVTPLTISSKEVKEFNFNETNLSKHVWLYEGSTEYYAHHMQVWAGLYKPEQFLTTLSQKINISRSYFKDSLSFTELSTESAGKWKDQYGNVYMKGALISACLDIYLLQLSNGQYGLKNLKHDLGIKYGKDKYFNDSELFDEIGQLTYPEIKNFLVTYVEGNTPIPYEKYFNWVGVSYLPKETVSEFSIGVADIAPTADGKFIVSTPKINEFGKKMGYQNGDELVSLNNIALNLNSIGEVIREFYATAKENDKVAVAVKRKNAAGEIETIVLTASAMKINKQRSHTLKLNNNATSGQIKLRNAWLNVK